MQAWPPSPTDKHIKAPCSAHALTVGHGPSLRKSHSNQPHPLSWANISALPGNCRGWEDPGLLERWGQVLLFTKINLILESRKEDAQGLKEVRAGLSHTQQFPRKLQHTDCLGEPQIPACQSTHPSPARISVHLLCTRCTEPTQHPAPVPSVCVDEAGEWRVQSQPDLHWETSSHKRLPGTQTASHRPSSAP